MVEVSIEPSAAAADDSELALVLVLMASVLGQSAQA